MKYQLISAHYSKTDYYRIPADWKIEDYQEKWGIKWGKVYCDGIEGEVPCKMTEFEMDEKRPDEVQTESDNWREYISEDEGDESDDEPEPEPEPAKMITMIVSAEEREMIIAFRAKQGTTPSPSQAEV